MEVLVVRRLLKKCKILTEVRVNNIVYFNAEDQKQFTLLSPCGRMITINVKK